MIRGDSNGARPYAARIFWRLVKECGYFPVRLAAALVSLLGVALGRLYLTWLVKLWTETPLSPTARLGFDRLFTKALVVTVGIVVSLFLSRYLLNSINQRVIERLRAAMHSKLVTAGFRGMRQRRDGEWLSRIFNDVGALSGFVKEVLKRLVGESAILVGAFLMMFYLNWRLALLACLVLPAVGALLNLLGCIIRRRGATAQQCIGEVNATLSEQLAGLTTIKGFQAEAREHQRFVDQNARYRTEVLRSEWWTAFLTATVWLITGTGLLAMLRYSTDQVLSGAITAGQVLAFVLYALQVVEPLRRLSDVQASLQRAIASAARVYEVIDEPDPQLEGAMPLPADLRGELEFDEVCFRYRPDRPVLGKLVLRVRPCETVAVVSTSGGGKSTLAALLLRFIDPQHGRILLDGVDIAALRVSDLRGAVCVVEQSPFVFSGTLLDNIRYGSPHANSETIEAAASIVGLDPLVRAIPGGLKSELLEGGRDLSQGQKQRIALARAIVRDPSVLVLDEATSALDSDSEGQVLTELEPWLRQRTVLIMAHRLSTISRCERIVVLQDGRVAGDSNLRDLSENCLVFRGLFAEQLAIGSKDHLPKLP